MDLKPPLDALLDALQLQHRTLLRMVGRIENTVIANALLREAREILFRIHIVQSLVSEPSTLRAAMEKFSAADAQLTQDIQALHSAADVVSAITKYLAAVDELIDSAKTFANVPSASDAQGRLLDPREGAVCARQLV